MTEPGIIFKEIHKHSKHAFELQEHIGRIPRQIKAQKTRIERMEKEFKEDEVEKILNILKDVMLFDPEKSTYTKEKGQKSIQYVKDKHVKTGLSFYVLSGQAKQYAKKS